MPVGMGSKGWIREKKKKVERSRFTDYIILTSKGKKKRIKDDPKFVQMWPREWPKAPPLPKKKKTNKPLTSKEKQHSKYVLN